MSTPAPRRIPRAAVAAFLLAAMILGVFGQVGTFDYVRYDDGRYVFENPIVSGGLRWRNVVWAFTTATAANWHPLTWISHMVDVELFGLAPGGHHLANVALHLANALLLLAVLARMTGAFWRAFVVAALFAVHPLHVESVAWISERKDLLSALFLLLGLAAYLRYVRRPTWRLYLAVFFAHLCALMAKQMAVTFPLALLLLDHWPLSRWRAPRASGPVPGDATGLRFRWLPAAEKIPLLLLSTLASFAAIVAQRSGGALVASEVLPLSTRIANAFTAYATYIGKGVWPEGLAVLYPHQGARVPILPAIASGVAVLAVTALVVRARRLPYLAVGWLWYVVTLVPVIGLIQIGIQSRADRYTYLPFVGLFVAAVFLAHDIAARGGLRRLAPIVAAAAIVAYGSAAWVQTGYWRDTESLFLRALKVTKNNWLAHNNLGIVYYTQGRYPLAIEQLEQVVRIYPKHSMAHYSLGMAYLRSGQTTNALRELNQAVAVDLNNAQAHIDLGLLLIELGNLDGALDNFRRAMAIDAGKPDAYLGIGVVLERKGMLPDAERFLREALDKKPDSPMAHYTLARLLARNGMLHQAMAHYRESLRLNPNSPEAHNNLANLLLRTGNAAEAIAHYREALRITPGDAEIRSNLDQALELSGGN